MNVSQKILIVDDDRDSLKLIGLMLQRRGYQILVAQNGAQALAKAETDSPDLIILDVMMPDIDGFEVCRRLRSDPATVQIPIIMFTAKTQVTDKVAGFQAGADDYLTKPIHPAELAGRVEAVLLRSVHARVEAAKAVPVNAAAFVGSKGGVGTTTLALNVAVAMSRPEVGQGKRVILAELVPGSGSIGLHLGYNHPVGLANLIAKPVEELDTRAVESQLTSHASGARMLLASAEPRWGALPAPQIEVIVRHLAQLGDLLLIELGTSMEEAALAVLKLCNYIVLVVEPQRVSLTLAQAALARIASIDVARDKVGLVLFNRAPSAASVSKSAVEGLLGPVISVIPPAPELAFQSAEMGVPLFTLQPDSLVSSQIRDLARLIATK
jgi:CheY-like chemotaxis protein